MDKDELYIPYKVGDQVVIIATITDREKSFDFIGKLIYERLNLDEYGIVFNKVSFDRNKYVDNIHGDMLTEIDKELAKARERIEKMLMTKKISFEDTTSTKCIQDKDLVKFRAVYSDGVKFFNIPDSSVEAAYAFCSKEYGLKEFKEVGPYNQCPYDVRITRGTHEHVVNGMTSVEDITAYYDDGCWVVFKNPEDGKEFSKALKIK